MKAVVAAFNQEKALVGAFSVITNLRMDLFEALIGNHSTSHTRTQTLSTAIITFPSLTVPRIPPGAGSWFVDPVPAKPFIASVIMRTQERGYEVDYPKM